LNSSYLSAFLSAFDFYLYYIFQERRLKIRRSKAKEKLPSGITADYSAPFLAKLDNYQEANRDTEEFVSINNTVSMSDNHSLIFSQNEYAETSKHQNSTTPKSNRLQISSTYLQVKTSPSMSEESLASDSTNSIFATPPLSPPIGESQGFYSIPKTHSLQDLNLPLPAIKLIDLPKPRELKISRQNNVQKDFGFSLRKANIVLNRSNSQGRLTIKSVIFAEPGANCKTTGLLPGDRLISINGVSVEDLPREEIIDMIKKSGQFVKVVVQPVAELSELSKRCMPENDGLQTDYNTLKRSASKRLKIEVR
jgi:PDZ domain